MSELRIQRLVGRQIAGRLADLAQLRITVFREFPYLYAGSADYEASYLQTYVDSPDSVIVVVLDGERVVGASSGIPLAHEVADFQRPFRERGYAVERIFYCAESVLLPDYRGHGLGVRFFAEREDHARRLGRFEWVCFCAVERPADHPRRPAGYVPLDAFWRRRGYGKHPELQTTFSWRDLDEAAASPKPMVFWLKRLERK
ncbi:MAG: GNAT family N-acetyltransferase [Pseudomonadota bacterium]|nr:GNAT family N-acetyltransferase [Pseudomonadota bacterium]